MRLRAKLRVANVVRVPRGTWNLRRPPGSRALGRGQAPPTKCNALRLEETTPRQISPITPAHDMVRVAQAVRRACVRAAVDGYEEGGLSGLCAEGRFEMAIDSMQALDLDGTLPGCAD